MIKLVLTVIVITLAGILATAQDKKSDRENAGLIGPVNSVRSSSSDYTGEKIVGDGFMIREGDLVIYDVNGRETERNLVSDFGEPMGKVTRSYNTSGLMVESRWTDKKGVLLRRDTFNYSDGILHESLAYDGAGNLIEKTVYTYDPISRLVAEIYYDAGQALAKTIYKYKEGKDPVEISFFMANGDRATAPVGPCAGAHRLMLEYNEKGQMISRTAFY
jgi:hypothetical protein